MIDNDKKVTVPDTSAVTDGGQPPSPKTEFSIPDTDEKCNDDFENERTRQLLRRINPPDYLHTVSLSELYDTVFQPRVYLIDGLLCTGAFLFAGAPKIGKSFFMAQLGYHISNGKSLWGYSVDKGSVLYLALEDDYSRLQKRLSRMFGIESTDNLHFATHAKNLYGGLDDQLKKFMRENPNTKLIIIDTLQKIREVGGEKFSYASDYENVTKIKQLADQYGICIMLVHHTRKQAADDCFDTISGTNGLLGAADGAFILNKEKRTDNTAVLDIVGRDLQDQRLHLLFDRERFVWDMTSAETELWKEPPEPILDAVAGLVTQDAPEWIGSASELLASLGTLDVQPNVLTRRLNIGASRLLREHGVRYESSRRNAGRIVKLTLDDPGV